MHQPDSASPQTPLKVLIVGCGYVGRRAAGRWVERGAHVSALTRSQENAQRFRDQGIHPVLGDVTQPESLGVLPAADVLLYAVGLDRTSGHSQRDVYVTGLEHVLERVAGKIGRLIYISSTSVYGQHQGEWIDEASVCEPKSPNGLVCLDAEELIWRHARNGAFQQGANVLRLAGIYGPDRLIARVNSLRSGAALDGNPAAWLNLIHVEDAVQAIFACCERGTVGRTYLVCDDRPLERRTYYESVAALVGAPLPRFADELPASEKSQLNKRCRNRRLHEELGVTLRFPDIHSGLADALRDQI